LGKKLTAARNNQQDIRVCDVPRRTRQVTLTPGGSAEQTERKEAQYRLGVKKYGGVNVETLLFLRAGGLEVGYYTIYFDFDGCFVDFTFYDDEKEVRAVYESFAVCDDGKTTLTEVLERDLSNMGYYIPQLRAELNDLRLTCESSGSCGSTACVINCPLQVRYRPDKGI